MSDVNMEQMPDLGRFVDWVWNLKAERDQLRAELDHRDKLLEETRRAWDMSLKACEELRAERDSHQRLCIAEMENNSQLRAELEAIRGQEPVAWVSPDAVGGTRWKAGALQQLNDGSPLYALPPQQPDAVSVPRELLEWAVERWHAEVSQRPLGNVHRRTLDDTWRQIITKLGGDHGLLCGQRHDALLSTKNAEEV